MVTVALRVGREGVLYRRTIDSSDTAWRVSEGLCFMRFA